MDALDRLGDEVVVLGCLQWEVDARRRADLARPHASRNDDVLGSDVTAVGADPDGATLRRQDLLDAGVLQDLCPVIASAACERHRRVDRVDTPFVGKPVRGQRRREVADREQPGRFGGGDLVHLDAHTAHEGGRPPALLDAFLRVGRLDVPHLAPAGGVTGSRFEVSDQIAPVGVELARPLVAEQTWARSLPLHARWCLR